MDSESTKEGTKGNLCWFYNWNSMVDSQLNLLKQGNNKAGSSQLVKSKKKKNRKGKENKQKKKERERKN